jgi:hypothetical protein
MTLRHRHVDTDGAGLPVAIESHPQRYLMSGGLGMLPNTVIAEV